MESTCVPSADVLAFPLRRFPFTSAFDKTCESAGKFTDPVRFPTLNGPCGYEFTADPQRSRPRQDVSWRGFLIDSARSDQRNLRIHFMNGSNVAFSANVRAR